MWAIIARLNQHRGLKAIWRNPWLSAWPFVVVILTQMAVSGLSVYTMAGLRTFISGESLWSKGQHEAIYFLSLYIDTGKPEYLASFKRTIAVPLAYQYGRDRLEAVPPDLEATRRAFIEGGTTPEDVPRALWIFAHFRGFHNLEDAISRWKEADRFIFELQRLGETVETQGPFRQVADLRERLEAIDAAIAPRTVVFSRTLEQGARLVEKFLLIVNFVLAGVLTVLTIWRVGKTQRQRAQYESALSWQASHDALTGLENRRMFEQRLAEIFSVKKGVVAPTCALMFIDLDQFKIVNDTCGHAAGDAMLRRICPALLDLMGPHDHLARLGGDEFGILLVASDFDRATAIAEAVRATVERVDFIWSGRKFSVTASIGIVHDRLDAVSPEEMMSKADVACFMAKEKGRNRVHTHCVDDRDLRGRVREMNWVQRIQRAVDEDRLCLFAQEIVSLTDDAQDGIHLEVLVRMHDEFGVLVPPSSFLPAAERFGLMKMIDRWVVRSVFDTLTQRDRSGLPPITCCAINLSGATIGDDAFLEFLKQLFRTSAIAPETICFEVTETMAIVDLEAARLFIHDLRALGCTFALDDFGSGMSSFSYLKDLPVDYLKIDGAFVKNLLSERADRAMVEMINHVGHVMGKKIVAEFVETQELAMALRDIGVDYAQGYGIAKPKPFTATFEAIAKPSRQPKQRRSRLIA